MKSKWWRVTVVRRSYYNCHYYAKDKNLGDRWIARLSSWTDNSWIRLDFRTLFRSSLIQNPSCRMNRFFLQKSATRRGSCTSRQRTQPWGLFLGAVYGERILKYDPLYSLSAHIFSLYTYKCSLPLRNVSGGITFLKSNAQWNPMLLKTHASIIIIA